MTTATRTAAPRFTKTQAARLFNAADQAGRKAAAAVTPTPSYVGTAVSLFDNRIDTTKPVYYDTAGICGFAWVMIRPGNSSFARWAKAAGFGYAAYGGGVRISARNIGGQSYEIKTAWAGAFAAVLREAGVDAYADGRLD